MSALRRRIRALVGWRRFGLALAAGALLALGQPPVSWPVVLFVSLPALLWLLDGASGPGAAFRVGWAAGLGFFAAGLFWIAEPFLVDAATYGWMAPFALVGMSAGLALFWGAPFAVARALWTPHGARIFILAALWTLSDYARSHVLTGFPWALHAYAWVETPVIQAVAVVGPHGLGFLTIVVALLPGLALPRGGALAATGLALALVAGAWGLGALRLAGPLPERDPPLLVRLVQPNAAQDLKWDPALQQAFFERHLAETRAPAERMPDVTIWPETAVPFVLGYADDMQREVVAAARGGPVILGIRRVEATPEREDWFNSLAVLRPDGAPWVVYDKHRLVPFGEYIPLSGLIDRWGLPALRTLTRSGFTAGAGPHVLSAPGLPPFLPLICYEAIFPHGLRAPEGRAEWLVQVTNDAWFGEVAGPYQHFAQARVRAIEQGLPLARAANTGISAMVDPMGRVLKYLPLGVAGHLDALLPPALPSTLYARFGDPPAIIAILLIFGLTVANFCSGILFQVRR